MTEVKHLIRLLERTKKALVRDRALELKEISNQTVHTATTKQDSSSIILAVIIYTLSKLIERRDHLQTKNWATFQKKFQATIDLAIRSLKKGQFDKYTKDVENLRHTLSSISPNMKQYIQEVMRKASINKASKLYEHGLSMEQTAKLLGVTQWELAEYTGQKDIPSPEHISIKQRAKMAVEFFS